MSDNHHAFTRGCLKIELRWPLLFHLQLKSFGFFSKKEFINLLLKVSSFQTFFFVVRKSKADTTGHDNLDEYDFGEDEDADEEPAEIEIHSEDGQESEI